MNSERIKTLASFTSKSDIVLDVGCDHGYLSIYLKKNNLVKDVYASEISPKALKGAQNNFQKYNVKIKSFLSDGFKDIPVSFNTAVIAGMGTNTIIDILNNEHIPPKLIIDTHNEQAKLRNFLNNLGYSLEKETAIYEKGHYYNIMLFGKGYQKLKKKEILFGISNNQEYYLYLINKNKELLKKVPLTKKIKLLYENHLLKGLTEKK